MVDPFPTGRISLTVEHAGFEKLVRTGVVLTAADTVVNLQLSVGNVQQTVEVQPRRPWCSRNRRRFPRSSPISR
jgi:hypothetical protein